MKKRVLCYFLAAIMLVSILPVTMFAETAEKYRDVEGGDFTYVALGDSTTNGYCLDGYEDEPYGFYQIVEKSYPYLIKEKLEAEGKTVNFYPYGVNAMRPDDLDAILDPNHWDDDFTNRAFIKERFVRMANNLPGIHVTTPAEAELVLRNEMCTSIANADLITYYLGGNTFGTFIQAALTSNRYGDDDTLEDLLNNVTVDVPFTMEQIKGIQAQVMDLLKAELGEETMTALQYGYGDLADLCVHAFVSFVIYFEKNIQTIRYLNPDCDIVVLGLHDYIKFIKANISGVEVNLGEVYGYLMELANVYATQLSQSADAFYYADLENAAIEIFFDELLAGEPVDEMQVELDWYIGEMVQGVLAQMLGGTLPPEMGAMTAEDIGALLRHWNDDGFTTDTDFAILTLLAPAMMGDEIPEMPEGVTLQDALRIAWLYYNEDDAFVEAIYPLIEDTELASELKDHRGNYATFSEFEDEIEYLEELSYLGEWIGLDYSEELEEMNALLETLDDVGAQLDGVRNYGKIQDVMLSCVNTDTLSMEDLTNLNLTAEQEAAIANDIMNAALNGAEVTALTRLAINLNFLFLFNDGMCIHPTPVGYQTIADIVWAAYQGKQTAKPYMSKKNVNRLADLVDELTANLVMPESDGNCYCTADNYDTYVSLGDSTVFGYGIDGDYYDDTCGYQQCAETAYPALLCKELGIAEDGFTQLAMSNLCVEDIRYILEENYNGDWHAANLIEQLTDVGGIEKVREEYTTKIKNAELVTLSMGSNNFLATSGYVLNEITAGRQPVFDWTQYSNSEVMQYKDLLNQLTAKIKEINPDVDTGVLSLFAEGLLYGYAGLLENCGAVLDDIHSINPNAKVVLTSIYDPIRNVYYKVDENDADYKPIYLDKIVDYLLVSCNESILNEVKSRDYCCYADISNVELFVDKDPIAESMDHNVGIIEPTTMLPLYGVYLMNNGESVHPSPAGHAYIKDQIMGVIGHHYGQWIEETTATCTVDGEMGHYHCDKCGKNFDADYNELISLTIPAGHDFVEAWSVSKNFHWHICTNCTEVSDKTKHEFGDDSVCDICGYEQAAAVCHAKQTVSALTSGESYTFFNASGNELHEITVESSSDKWLLQSDKGWLTFTKKNNGDYSVGYSENKSDAYEWTFSDGCFTAAVTTQSSGGSTSSRTTTYYLVDGTKNFTVSTSKRNLPTLYLLVEATEHTFGAWTKNNKDTHTRTCTRCGVTDTQKHSFTDTVTPAMPKTRGYTTHTCTVCAYSYVDSYTEYDSSVGIQVEPYSTGDLNGDGYLNGNDVAVLGSYLAAKTAITGEALAAADVNGDGTVSSQDMVALARQFL